MAGRREDTVGLYDSLPGSVQANGSPSGLGGATAQVSAANPTASAVQPAAPKANAPTSTNPADLWGQSAAKYTTDTSTPNAGGSTPAAPAPPANPAASLGLAPPSTTPSAVQGVTQDLSPSYTDHLTNIQSAPTPDTAAVAQDALARQLTQELTAAGHQVSSNPDGSLTIDGRVYDLGSQLPPAAAAAPAPVAGSDYYGYANQLLQAGYTGAQAYALAGQAGLPNTPASIGSYINSPAGKSNIALSTPAPGPTSYSGNYIPGTTDVSQMLTQANAVAYPGKGVSSSDIAYWTNAMAADNGAHPLSYWYARMEGMGAGPGDYASAGPYANGQGYTPETPASSTPENAATLAELESGLATPSSWLAELQAASSGVNPSADAAQIAALEKQIPTGPANIPAPTDPTNGAEASLVNDLLAHPEPLDPATVEALQSQGADALDQTAQAQDDALRKFGFAAGAGASPWLAAARADTAAQRRSAIAGNNQNVAIQAAQTNTQAKQQAAQIGANYQAAQAAIEQNRQQLGISQEQATASFIEDALNQLSAKYGVDMNFKIDAAQLGQQSEQFKQNLLYEIAALQQADQQFGSSYGLQAAQTQALINQWNQSAAAATNGVNLPAPAA